MGGEETTYSVICFQIVNLLLIHDAPEILADELDDVELVGESGTVAREAFTQALSDAEAEPFQSNVDTVTVDLGRRFAIGGKWRGRRCR